MQLDKLNCALEYEFILKHKNLKEYCENYFKYKEYLKYKYDLYTLVYIKDKTNVLNNDVDIINDDINELYLYLGITNNIYHTKKHIFICCNIKVNLVYNEFGITDEEIENRFIINKVNIPNEIFKKYVKCLTDTYEIVGY